METQIAPKIIRAGPVPGRVSASESPPGVERFPIPSQWGPPQRTDASAAISKLSSEIVELGRATKLSVVRYRVQLEADEPIALYKIPIPAGHALIAHQEWVPMSIVPPDLWSASLCGVEGDSHIVVALYNRSQQQLPFEVRIVAMPK